MFDTGKSFFKAFTMPDFTEQYSIYIHSYLLGDYIDHSHIFIPQLVFLNDNYEVTRISKASTYKVKKTALSETLGLRFKVEGHIDISHKNKDEKYFIVRTTNALIKSRTQVSIMHTVPIMIIPGSIIPLPSGEKDVLIPNSPFGKLKIDLN